MAYQTGTSTGPNDLLDKLRVFAAAQGWTVNRNVTAGNGKEVCLSKGTAFVNLRSYESEQIIINGFNPPTTPNRYGIAINGSDSYSAGNAWDRQPGYPLRKSTDLGDQGHGNLPMPIFFGPFPSYHLFSPNTDCIYLEVEVTTGSFQRLGFGKLALFNSGAAGGGRFFYATGGDHPATTANNGDWLGSDVDNTSVALELVPFRAADYAANNRLPGSFVRAAFDSFDNWAGSGRNASFTQMSQACQGGGCHDKIIRDLSPSPRNGVGVMAQNIVSVNRGDEYLSPVGVVPGMRYMDMTIYQPQAEFTLGADVWKVFPWYKKGGVLSANRAIAYLKA